MGKLTAEQKVCEYNRGQKAVREGRSRSWSEPWAYPFESDQHYEERREAFNQGYGIIDATPLLLGDLLRNDRTCCGKNPKDKRRDPTDDHRRASHLRAMREGMGYRCRPNRR